MAYLLICLPVVGGTHDYDWILGKINFKSNILMFYSMINAESIEHVHPTVNVMFNAEIIEHVYPAVRNL